VNVSLPLIDIDQTTGPTAIWPGSHRWVTSDPPREAMVSIPFQRGDCILMDYRTLHTGLPNHSQKVRPILYLVYTREWFFDDNNHRQRIPLDMPLADIEALPEELSLLMLRARQQALRLKQLDAAPV
jgi:ectoine hydroxylase-related dioxygenase (phytanoyl-CoA dioxygenase family)